MVKHFDRNATVVDLMGWYIGDATLHTLSQPELTDVFSSKIKQDNDIYTDNAGQYMIEAKDAKDRYDHTPTNYGGRPKAEIDALTTQRKSYWNELERSEKLLDGIDAEVKEISEASAKEATELTKLEKDLTDLSISGAPYNFDLRGAEEAIFSIVGGQRNPDLSPLEDALTTYDYENNGKVKTRLEKIENVLAGDTSLLNIYRKRSEIQPIIKELSDTKSNIQKSAENDIKDHFKKYDADVTDKYKETKKKVDEYAHITGNLNQSWLNVVKTYGKKLVNKEKLTDNEKKNKDYKKLSGAYIGLKIGEAYLNPDYIEDELIRIDGIASRKDALKEITALQEDIDSVKDGILETLNEEIKDAYKNVIMGSSLDSKQNNTGEFDWFMFGKDEKIVENHAVETYAQGGIGMFQEMFLADPDSETEFYELQDEVVKKHKKASSWLHRGFSDLFNGKKNYRIGVYEVLKIGLGYAVYLNHSDDITDELNYTWRDIRDLHSLGASNSIEEILDIYHDASKLGEKVNDTAREWTEREHIGYRLVDNQVNGLSGWSFKIVDSVWDFVGSRIESFKKPEASTAYKVDETAIKPKYHPHLQMLLGGIGAGAILTMTANEVIEHLGSDESVTDKIKHTLGPFGELAKEGAVAGIVHKAMESKPHA